MKKLISLSFLIGIVSGGLYLIYQPKKAECFSCGRCSPYVNSCYTGCTCMIMNSGAMCVKLKNGY